MAVDIKRLAQSALSASVATRYTAPSGKVAQITEIYLVNNGAVERKVDIHQGGTAVGNRILRNIIVPPEGSVMMQNLKIVIAGGQTLAAKQDTGTDIIMTLYGVEEAV